MYSEVGQVSEEIANAQSGIEFACLDETEDFLPIFMHRSLAIAYKPDTFLHECTNIEYIGETGVGRNNSTTTHFLNRDNHLAEGGMSTHLTVSSTSVQHECLLDFVHHSLGFVESA